MSSRALRQFILGLETVPGDAAVPDVALRVSTGSFFRPVVTKTQPDEDIGSFSNSRHYIAELHGEGKLLMNDAYYEGAPYPISMALGAGAVTGVADPYTFTWALPHATAPTFATYRVETTDGNNHIVSSNDVFATNLEITGEAAGAVTIAADLVGGATTYPAALGAVLTPLTTPTSIIMAETTITLDDLFANIGTTTMPMLISFNWKLEGLQHPKQFAGSLYPTGRGNDKWQITLEVMVEIDQAKMEAEKDKLLTTGLTAIRIKALNSVNDSLSLSGMYRLQDVGELDERDGNNIVKFTYIGQRDTLGNNPSVVCVTNLAAL